MQLGAMLQQARQDVGRIEAKLEGTIAEEKCSLARLGALLQDSQRYVARLENFARYDVNFWLANVSWLSILRTAQEEIASGAPVPWYSEPRRGTYPDGTTYDFPPYRSAEAFQWLHLARWIHEDAAGGGVRRCLDVGSGYGTLSLFTHLVSGCQNHAVDFISEYMSPALVARRGFQFKICNVELEAVPFEGPFDAILFSEVLEHLNFHPLPTLKKLVSVLAPAGRLYLSTPDASMHGRLANYSSYESMPQPEAGRPVVDAHVYVYEERELKEVLAAAGLRVERFAYAPGWAGFRHFNVVCVRA
jgi:SAM-dependent methyltransferase